MSVEDPVSDGLAKFDCNLDNLFGVFRDRDREKAEAALPLELHIVGRPVDDKAPESFPQDDLPAACFEVPRRGRGFGEDDHSRLGGQHADVQGLPPNGQKARLGERTAKAAEAARSKGQREGVGDDDWTTEPRGVRGPKLSAFPRATVQG